MGIRKGEDLAKYRKRQYVEDGKTAQRILECLDGLNLEDAMRVLGLVKQTLHQRVKITLPFDDE